MASKINGAVLADAVAKAYAKVSAKSSREKAKVVVGEVKDKAGAKYVVSVRVSRVKSAKKSKK